MPPCRWRSGRRRRARSLHAHILVAGIQDEVFHPPQRTGTPLPELLVQPGRRPAHVAGAEVQPAHGFEHGGHLAGRDPLDVHLRHAQLLRPLGAFALLESRRVELDPAAHLGNPQRQVPDPALHILRIVAVGVATAFVRT